MRVSLVSPFPSLFPNFRAARTIRHHRLGPVGGQLVKYPTSCQPTWSTPAQELWRKAERLGLVDRLEDKW